MEKITIYTDGSTLNNGAADARCGWAYKIIEGDRERMKSGSDIGKTNNQMEMTAVLFALQDTPDKSAAVRVYSDSRYVVETLNGNFRIQKNEALWTELLKEVRKFKNIKFIWVKGHDKNQHNNDVDNAARGEAEKLKGTK